MAFDWKSAGAGATTGAGIGSVFGPWGTAGGAAIGGLAGGFLGGESSEETSMQKTKRELVDQLLGSLNGQGPYSDLFTANEADFQRSFADPARARFKNQTAPQIQQAYIASGQQRGTGLEDTLARAGVSMDDMLNQNYLNYQQGAQNRKTNAIGNILNQDKGADNPTSFASEYFGSDQFGGDLDRILQSFTQNKDNNESGPQSLAATYQPPRKGFENDQQFYNTYTGVMG